MGFLTSFFEPSNIPQFESSKSAQSNTYRYKWTLVSDRSEFPPMDGAGALSHMGRMWLVGGWNPENKEYFPMITNNAVYSSHDGLDWSLEKKNSFLDGNFEPSSDWEGRHTAGYVVYRNKMWIIGGDANQGHYQSDIWNSEDGKNWEWVNERNPVPWGARVLHYTVVFRDKIWIMGGQTLPHFAPDFAPTSEIYYSDIWTTTDGLNWQSVIPDVPYWSPRGMICGSIVFKDRMWILGGGTYNSEVNKSRDYYNDVWSSPDGIKWTLHTDSAPWNPRQYHSVVVFDDHMWVLAGADSSENRNDVWFSDNGVDWTELPNTPWRPRHASSVFAHDDHLWVVAGSNRGRMEGDVWRLDKLTDES